MMRTNVWHRTVSAGGSVTLGACCGVLLAAFGNSISGSSSGVVVTIFLAGALGAWIGRLSGAVVGAIGGALLVALGSVIGGSPGGVVLTIAACALLAGLCRWLHDAREARLPNWEKILSDCRTKEETYV
jgi:hypothetical protein